MKRIPLVAFSALLLSLAAASAQNLVYQGRMPYSNSGCDVTTGTTYRNSTGVDSAILLIGPAVDLLDSQDLNDNGVILDFPLTVHPYAFFEFDTKQKTFRVASVASISQTGAPGSYSQSADGVTVDAVKLDSAGKKVIMDVDLSHIDNTGNMLFNEWLDDYAGEISGPAKFGKPIPSASSPMWFATTMAGEPMTSDVNVAGLYNRGRPAAEQPIPGEVTKYAPSYTLDTVLTKQVFSLPMAEAIAAIRASLVSKGYTEAPKN